MSQPLVFDYANLTGRPPGRLVAAIGRVLPGVARVERQVQPYAAAWRDANLAALERPGPRWIVLGDSMSQGIGASRFDAGWVNQVQARLIADGQRYEIINLSASGATVADVLAQQLPAWRGVPMRTDSDPRPDLVTLLIGSNDLFRKANRAELPGRFAEVLRELPEGAVVASMPQPRSAAVAANARIAEAVTARGIVVADMQGGGPTSWKGKLAEDHFHPNDDGYAGIAETFYRALSAITLEEPPATT
jgi:lysophospholipase L1-like esterase